MDDLDTVARLQDRSSMRAARDDILVYLDRNAPASQAELFDEAGDSESACQLAFFPVQQDMHHCPRQAL
jgi:hypothetical protein